MNSIRFVGLDVHRESVRACIRDSRDEIVSEHSLGCTREELESFARSHLTPSDAVALEATFHSWAIVDVLAPHVGRVVVSNPLATKAIAESKVKTDKIDARVLSELLRCDYLPEVWTPNAHTRELRATCARRAGLVSDVVRIKNRIHGVLAKALVPRPKGELFDRKGRLWLEALESLGAIGSLTKNGVDCKTSGDKIGETQIAVDKFTNEYGPSDAFAKQLAAAMDHYKNAKEAWEAYVSRDDLTKRNPVIQTIWDTYPESHDSFQDIAGREELIVTSVCLSPTWARAKAAIAQARARLPRRGPFARSDGKRTLSSPN